MYAAVQGCRTEASTEADGQGTFWSTGVWAGPPTLLQARPDVSLFVRQFGEGSVLLPVKYSTRLNIARLMGVKLASEFLVTLARCLWLESYLSVQRDRTLRDWAVCCGGCGQLRWWERVPGVVRVPDGLPDVWDGLTSDR